MSEKGKSGRYVLQKAASDPSIIFFPHFTRIDLYDCVWLSNMLSYDLKDVHILIPGICKISYGRNEFACVTKDFEIGNYPGLPRWVQCNHSLYRKHYTQRRYLDGNRSQRGGASLLVQKMHKEAMNQRRYMAPTNWKVRKHVLPQNFQKDAALLTHFSCVIS